MEYRREANSGTYVVFITFLFGALGLAYGVAQIVGADSVEASSTGDTIFLALMAGGVWGMIGLIFGSGGGAPVKSSTTPAVSVKLTERLLP